MEMQKIVLFGEAEKGEYRTPYFCRELDQLVEFLGHPPPDSLGLYYAIQALMYKYPLIFFRVKEEGFSLPDYYFGLRLLEHEELARDLVAICVPGIGTGEIMESLTALCQTYHSVLITNEKDLYDYLTEHCA